MRTGLLFTFLSFAAAVSGQDNDTLIILSLDKVLELAKENHPIIRQACLQDGLAEAQLRIAKGKFDPKLSSAFDSKNLRGTNYYSKFHSFLKVPTWFPLDPKVEINRNHGDYLNQEHYISSPTNYWQIATGISLPLGKGLFIDERRALIKQARIFGDQAEAEKIKLINETLFEITKSYWNWYLAFREYELTTQSLEIAQNLFDRIKLDYELGEAAVVDTVQAKITYQSRNIDFQKAVLELTQAKLAFSVHLWGPNEVPLELAEEATPSVDEHFEMIPSDSSINTLVVWASENHPEILKISAKQSQYEVDQRWYRESLKPEINLSYSLLDAPVNVNGLAVPQLQDNYKLGLEFSFPLFLRKERGNLQKVKLYIESLEYDRNQMRQRISAGVRNTYAELKTNEILVAEYHEVAEGYKRLLEAEFFNLENGESDLFKLNVQQDKYIESQMKSLNALIKFKKLKAALPYAAGLPHLSYQKLYE